MRNYRKVFGWLIVFGLSVIVTPAYAADKPVNFVLDWIIGGRHAGWFTALEKGYYKAEGLDVSISRGHGSGPGIKRAVAGQADISFNDIATAIRARAKTGARIKAVAVLYTKHPSAIFTHKKLNIKTPKDLERATLADSAGSTNILLFPALAKAAGFDASKVKWVTVSPQAKMSVFISGKVDGTLFYNMQLPIMQLKTAKQGGVNMIEFGDYLKLYSNGILVTDDYLAKNKDTVRKFVRASMKGWAYAFKHPDEAVSLLKKNNPLVNPKIAKAELAFVKDLMLSPEAKKHGLGYMDEGKMRATRDTMIRLFKLKSVAMKDIYTNAYLPSAK